MSRLYRPTPHITIQRTERIVPGRGCRGTGKRGYRTASEAVVALNRIQTRTESGSIEDRCFAVRAYACECGEWHLSKDAKRRSASDLFPSVTIVTAR